MAPRRLSPIALAAIAIGHLTVTAISWRDIRHRSEEQMRGSKKLWGVLTAANSANSLAYLLFGRKRAGSSAASWSSSPT
jgi:hypothetical protein